MTNKNGIVVLQRTDIDDERWNACITNAANGLIYAYTWYLDTFALDWLGIIYDDYKAVMPLPVRKKFGIQYVYMPPLTGQLGVFGNDLTKELISLFIKQIPDKIKLIDYDLNNEHTFIVPQGSLSKKPNYILNLNRSFFDIASGFNTNVTRNLKKSKKAGKVVYLENEKEVVKMALEQFAHFSKNTLAGLQNYELLPKNCPPKNIFKNYGFEDLQGELIATASIISDGKKVYYLLASSAPSARSTGASHAIVNAIIKDFCEEDLQLDFEGSSISSIAFFYASFGAEAQHFQHLHVNKLNFIIKKLTGKS